MAKFYGKIGYALMTETAPGVYRPTIIERNYYGDVTKDMRRLEGSNQVNEDVNISNQISIVADPFAYQNFCTMRYVEYMGANWKVTNVDVRYPRLLLTLGGVYNGTTASGTPDDSGDNSGQ